MTSNNLTCIVIILYYYFTLASFISSTGCVYGLQLHTTVKAILWRFVKLDLFQLNDRLRCEVKSCLPTLLWRSLYLKRLKIITVDIGLSGCVH